MIELLILVVVGYINIGKILLLCILICDCGFGEVFYCFSIICYVEGVRLLVDGEVLLEFYDMFGLEDVIVLFDYLDVLECFGECFDGLECMVWLLDSNEVCGCFEQEVKVVCQLFVFDVGFYVIDVCELVLVKYCDELVVFVGCGWLLLLVLNFVVSLQYCEEEWCVVFVCLGFYVLVCFDSVVLLLDGEWCFYESLVLLLECVWL